ncbi:MAG: hypothetical protein H8D34_23195 [Chloroflexi bacterium]|nr:hypothetical protein [Chloroflexota bacterium]
MDFVLTNTLLFGAGIFLLVFVALQAIGERASWWLARRRSRFWRLEGMTTQEHRQDPKEQGIPWVHMYLVTALLVLILFNWTGQVVVLGLALVPFALRSWLEAYWRKQIEAESLDWLIDLRINLPLHGSLLRTMRVVSESSDTRLARMTGRYLKRGFQGDGLALLERLAEDTHLSHLTDLVARVKAATEGTLNIDRPFEHALEQLRSEIYTQAREHQQRIPSRLTLLIFPVLLGPSIALLILPMAARLMATISGSSGWGGGF